MQLKICQPIRGIDVKLIDQYPLYELGSALHQLKEACKEGVAPVDLLMGLFGADAHIDALLEGKPVEVSYCRDAVERLRSLVDAGIEAFRDKEGNFFKADAPALGEWELGRIKSAIEVFEHQFSAELKKTVIYAVPRRGIFDTERLVTGAEAHLPDSIRESLPPFVVTEFREAGRCFAFGLFSASGFHALRAAESALKQYYAAFLGDPKKEELTMGLMASHLKDRAAATSTALPKPNLATLRTIADITSFDRNPLTHKELDLTEDDAAMLFNRAQGMIAMMAREIRDRADELQPPLPLLEAPASAAAIDLGLAPEKAKKKGKGAVT